MRDNSSPLRVLVVDRCKDNRDSLAFLLTLWGHAVRLAHDGPSALAESQAFRPHVVLIEIRLAAGMDGWDVGRRLREQQGSHRPLLVALTGFGQEQDRARSRAAGLDAHLTKPVDPRELRQLLATAADALSPVGAV